MSSSSSASQTSGKTMGRPSFDGTMENVTSIEKSAMPPGSPISRLHLITGSSSSSSSSSSTDLTTPTSTSSNFSIPTTPTPAPTTSARSLHPKYNCHKPQLCPKTGQAIEPLYRHYPKPEEEVDIEEALGRGPLPGRYWVVRGQTEDEEKRREEFEKVKRELRGWRGV